MKSLREYLDIIQQLDERITINPDGTTSGGLARPPAPAAPAAPASTSPWANDPAKDAAWKALSPEDQKWLGGADPTDKFILARAPNKGKAAAPAAAPAAQTRGGLAAPTAAAPAANAATPAPPAPTMSAADQEDADQGAAMKANQAAAIGANQDADDLAMGQAMTANAAQAAALASGAQDDATGVDKAVAANGAAPAPTMSAAAPAPAPAGQGASPAAPANRDAMPFGKAFADAKAKGESQFTWKGKPYAVQLEKPAARDPKGAYRGDRTEVTPPAPYNAAKDSQLANVGQAAALAAPNQSSAETARLARQKPAPAAAPAPAATPAQIAARTFESVGFQDDELSRIVSLVHHR